MTTIYSTFTPEQFDQNKLDALTANAVAGHDKFIVSFTYSFAEALADVQAKQLSGHTLDPDFVPLAMPLGNTDGSCSFMVRFIKPAKQIKTEIETIKKTVKAEYEEYLASEQTRAVSLMAARLVAEEEQRISKEAEAARQQRLEVARQEAQTILFGEPA